MGHPRGANDDYDPFMSSYLHMSRTAITETRISHVKPPKVEEPETATGPDRCER